MINTAVVEGIVYGTIVQKPCDNGGLYVRFHIRCVMANHKDATGKYPSIVVPCVAWNDLAKMVLKYVKVDDRIIVSGPIGSYFRTGPRGGHKLENYVIVNQFSTTDPFSLRQYEIIPVTEKVVKDDTLKAEALEGWDNNVGIPND